MFCAKEGGRWSTLDATQAEAIEAIKSTRDSGIVSLACGAGKTAIAILSCQECKYILYLTVNSDAVLQTRDAILANTTLTPEQVCVITGQKKDEMNLSSATTVAIATFAMFSREDAQKSMQTIRLEKTVRSIAWSTILVDEAHVTPGTRYEDLILSLKRPGTRILGFTGTLTKTLLGREETAVQRGEVTRDELMAQRFAFLGSVIYSKSWKSLEASGLIARVRFASIKVPVDPILARGTALAEGIAKLYAHALPLKKLQAAANLAEAHLQHGHAGLIYSTHIFPAEKVASLLGPRCQVLRGGGSIETTSGGYAFNTSDSTQSILDRLNKREIDIVICTSAADAALDIQREVHFVINLMASKSPTACAQRAGRAMRSKKLVKRADESESEFAARQKGAQRTVYFYDFELDDPDDGARANCRRQYILDQGYSFMQMNIEDIAPALRRDKRDALDLLFECYCRQEYVALRRMAETKKRAVRHEHDEKLKNWKDAVSGSSLKSEIYKEKLKRATSKSAKQQLKSREAEAFEEIMTTFTCASALKTIAQLCNEFDLDMTASFEQRASELAASIIQADAESDDKTEQESELAS